MRLGFDCTYNSIRLNLDRFSDVDEGSAAALARVMAAQDTAAPTLYHVSHIQVNGIFSLILELCVCYSGHLKKTTVVATLLSHLHCIYTGKQGSAAVPMPLQMWTKLRPGLRDFLQRASQHFELHICTMGDRDYAQQIAALLDPTRRLFAERIISSVRHIHS